MGKFKNTLIRITLVLLILLLAINVHCKYNLISTGPNPDTIFFGIFVNFTTGDDATAQGTKELPYKTIQKAIDNSGAGDNILVANGTYNENITLKNGVSVYGGYNSDWTNRDNINRENSTYKTEIIPVTSTHTVNAVSVSSTTKIDGFTIRSHSFGNNCINNESGSSLTITNNTIRNEGGGELYHKGIYNNNSSPKIEKNIIISGASFRNYGIQNYNSSPVIRYNSINGGSGSNSYAIYNESSSNPEIRFNSINGGSASSSSVGIYNATNSNPVIMNNSINGGSSTNSTAIVNDNITTSLVINANYIHGGNNGTCKGIVEVGACVTRVYNNVIYCGDGDSLTGISINSTGGTRIIHNTILGGNSSVTVMGIIVVTGSAQIYNNIVIILNGSDMNSMQAAGATIIQYNNVFVNGIDRGDVFYDGTNLVGIDPMLDENYYPLNPTVYFGGMNLIVEVPVDFYSNGRSVPCSIGAVEVG